MFGHLFRRPSPASRATRARRPRAWLEALEDRLCPATVFGLTTSNQLATFDSATPGSSSTPIAVTGLQSGDQLRDIDFRPATGQLYGLATGASNGSFVSTLTSDQEVPAGSSTSAATGRAVATLNAAGTALSVSIVVNGLDFGPVAGVAPLTPGTSDDVTLAHVHQAARGTNGPVRWDIILSGGRRDDDFQITLNADGSATITAIWENTDAPQPLSNFLSMLTGAAPGTEVPLYFNFHTTGNPAGVIRGQIAAAHTTGRLYTINTASGAATQVGPLLPLAGSTFAMDFNPVPDRLRIVTDADQNLRVNVDSTSTVGILPDGTLAYRSTDVNAGVNPTLVANAYSNSFSGTAGTTLFGIDTGPGILATQNPPNDGVLNTVNSLGIGTVTAAGGFDILTAGATNTGFAALTTGGVQRLYTVNLDTGAATSLGTTAQTLQGLAAVPASGVFVVGNDLVVIGRTGFDLVQITPVGAANGSTGVRVTALLGGVFTSQFFTQAFTTFRISLQNGGDLLSIAPSITIPAVVNAGTGFETMQLGAGNNTVVIPASSTAGGFFKAGNGNNTFTLGGGNNIVLLDNGNNTVTAGTATGTGFNLITVGNGNNNVTVQGLGGAAIFAGTGQNVIRTLNAQYAYVSVLGVSLIEAGTGPRGINLNGTRSVVVQGTASLTTGGDTLRAALDAYFVALGSLGNAAAEALIRSRVAVGIANVDANFLVFNRGVFDVIIKKV